MLISRLSAHGGGPSPFISLPRRPSGRGRCKIPACPCTAACPVRRAVLPAPHRSSPASTSSSLANRAPLRIAFLPCRRLPLAAPRLLTGPPPRFSMRIMCDKAATGKRRCVEASELTHKHIARDQAWTSEWLSPAHRGSLRSRCGDDEPLRSQWWRYQPLHATGVSRGVPD